MTDRKILSRNKNNNYKKTTNDNQPKLKVIVPTEAHILAENPVPIQETPTEVIPMLDPITESIAESKPEVTEEIIPEPSPEPTLPPELPVQWQVVAESSVGMAHRRMTPAVPCQDASLANSGMGRTALIVCDGAGSAKLSHIGSQTLVQSLNRLFYAMEGLLIRFLDGNDDTTYTKNLAEMIYRYAIHQMIDLGQTHARSDKDFRSTLLLAITGKKQMFWLKIGDGELVYEDRTGKLATLGEAGKGEFANITHFVDSGLTFDLVQYGSLPSADITGLAVMSDGASERLVSTDGQQIASKVGQFLQALRTEKLGREKLFQFFNDAQTWEGSTHDDKSLALAAR